MSVLIHCQVLYVKVNIVRMQAMYYLSARVGIFILNPELEVVNFSYICNFLGDGPVHVIYVGTR